jgi:hypothetical protein
MADLTATYLSAWQKQANDNAAGFAARAADNGKSAKQINNDNYTNNGESESHDGVDADDAELLRQLIEELAVTAPDAENAAANEPSDHSAENPADDLLASLPTKDERAEGLTGAMDDLQLTPETIQQLVALLNAQGDEGMKAANVLKQAADTAKAYRLTGKYTQGAAKSARIAALRQQFRDYLGEIVRRSGYIG